MGHKRPHGPALSQLSPPCPPPPAQPRSTPRLTTYQRYDERLLEAQTGGDREHGVQTGEQRGHDEHLAGLRVHRQPGQVEAERRQVLLRVQRPQTPQHLRSRDGTAGRQTGHTRRGTHWRRVATPGKRPGHRSVPISKVLSSTKVQRHMQKHGRSQLQSTKVGCSAITINSQQKGHQSNTKSGRKNLKILPGLTKSCS